MVPAKAQGINLVEVAYPYMLAALKLALELGDGFITCRHRDASGHLLSSSQGNFNAYLILEHRLQPLKEHEGRTIYDVRIKEKVRV
ncbi:hypothetical protein A2U01_0005197 [Trifolium medium]|uniref:Uncharacterized protein n=1 Tax=Trifolium medium TaxID=97028 RepID=A0A392MB84_9FABA|nr:hypothetical protein [Trifolium medium]